MLVAAWLLASCAAREVPLGRAPEGPDAGTILDSGLDAAPDASDASDASDVAADAGDAGNPGGGRLGDPCLGDNDCDFADPTCIDRVHVNAGGIDEDFCIDGGACTTACTSDADCPDGGLCSTSVTFESGGETPRLCMKPCADASDCRVGWSCQALIASGPVCTPPLDPC